MFPSGEPGAHVARFEFPRETGLLLRCAGKAGNPFKTTHPLGLALGSPIFPSGCEGKLGVALESLQGLRHLRETSRFPAALHLSHFSPPDRHRRVDSSALSGQFDPWVSKIPWRRGNPLQ